METKEIIIDNTWTKLADTGDDPATITNLSRSRIDIAFTSADSAPTVTYGHILGPNASLERYNSSGHIWGKTHLSGRTALLAVTV